MVFADPGRRLVEEVVPGVGDLPVTLGQPFPGLLPVGRSLPFPGEGPLEPFERLFVPGEEAPVFEDGSVREGGKPGNSHVDPDHVGRRRNRRIDLPFRLERNEPFFPRPSHGDVLDRSLDITAFPVANPSDLRESDPGVGFVELYPLGKPEGVVLTLLAELRKTGTLRKEVRIGPVEILEGLLEDLGVDAGEPDRLGFPFPEWEKVGRADISETLLPDPVAFDLQGQRPVEDEPAGPCELAHRPFLIFGRLQGEPEGLDSFHGSHFNTNQSTPYISGLKAGVLRRFFDK